MELKETYGSIDIHHENPKTRQGRGKQFKNVKLDFVLSSKRQATIQHCHRILNGLVEEHIIILNVS
jgi:hypothetical protein